MKIVAVASGRGGVGKSTVSLNLARAGPLVELVGRQLIRDVRWGELDYLIGPTTTIAPASSTVAESCCWRSAVPGGRSTQDAAHLDARKLLAMPRDAGVTVLGAVENMRGLRCPHCGELVDVFLPVAEDRSILRELPLLGSVPLDPVFAQLNGVPEPFGAIAERVASALE